HIHRCSPPCPSPATPLLSRSSAPLPFSDPSSRASSSVFLWYRHQSPWLPSPSPRPLPVKIQLRRSPATMMTSQKSSARSPPVSFRRIGPMTIVSRSSPAPRLHSVPCPHFQKWTSRLSMSTSKRTSPRGTSKPPHLPPVLRSSSSRSQTEASVYVWTIAALTKSPSRIATHCPSSANP